MKTYENENLLPILVTAGSDCPCIKMKLKTIIKPY